MHPYTDPYRTVHVYYSKQHGKRGRPEENVTRNVARGREHYRDATHVTGVETPRSTVI